MAVAVYDSSCVGEAGRTLLQGHVRPGVFLIDLSQQV